MRLSLVGHASVIIEASDVRLLTDPWLTGLAFNDSWALHPEPRLRQEDLDSLTHLWISHEHPDHFSPASLHSIPSEVRARVILLFQRRYSSEVVDFFATLGFRDVIELPHARFVTIAPGVEVYCRQIGHEDSCLAVRGEGQTILNLNDCVGPPTTLHKLKRDLGSIDLLLNQFSIAGWPGNPQETERCKRAGDGVLDQFVSDLELLGPRFVLPFASFMRWCHQENSYVNRWINRVEDVAARVDPGRLVVMYPGDVWEDLRVAFPGTEGARERHASEFEALEGLDLVSHDPVGLDDVVSAMRGAVEDISTHYHRFLLRRVPPVTFLVTDLQERLQVSLTSGVKVGPGAPTVELSSQAAWYTFKYRWGLPTLGISGRFRTNAPEEPFWRLKKLGSAYSAGVHTRADGQGLVRSLYDRRRASYLWARRGDLAAELVARLRS